MKHRTDEQRVMNDTARENFITHHFLLTIHYPPNGCTIIFLKCTMLFGSCPCKAKVPLDKTRCASPTTSSPANPPPTSLCAPAPANTPSKPGSAAPSITNWSPWPKSAAHMAAKCSASGAKAASFPSATYRTRTARYEYEGEQRSRLRRPKAGGLWKP